MNISSFREVIALTAPSQCTQPVTTGSCEQQSHRRFLKKRFLKNEYLNVYVLRVYLLCAIIAGIDLIPGSSDENAVTTAVKYHYNGVMRTASRFSRTFAFHEAP